LLNLEEYFPFPLDDFQLEAIRAINSGNSVVLTAPTGSGKTLIGEFAIYRGLSHDSRVFYTTPLKALSNQKFRDFANQYGEILLTLNSIQLADKLFLKIKEQRLKRRQKLAQSTIGKFSTIKASAVALNPLILFDVAGSFALDTALINELSKIYGLKLKGESTRKIFKNISINNLYLGVTQVGVNTSFNLIKKVILLTAPFTIGLSLLPYGPIAIIQAAIAVYSTKILGKLAAKEIFIRSKVSYIEPSIMIHNITFKEPDIFNHINVYLSKRNLNNNFVSFLP